MISGLGLGQFNPIDMKEAGKAKSKSSSFDSSSSQEVTPRSNTSSVSQNKSLEKSENKEFGQKVEKFSKQSNSQSEKVSSSESHASDKLKLTQKQVEESKYKGSEITEIPQMQMLQGVQPVFVNQQAAPAAEAKSSESVDLNLKVSQQAQPVLKFLKAMQENFGISPQQVMKALNELPQQTMLQTPHQAMTPLFEKLGLQPKQFTKAQILYTEMLTEMEKVQPTAFEGKAAMGAAGLGAAATMKSAELPAQAIERPISSAPKSTLDQLIEQKIARRAVEPQNLKLTPPQMPQPQTNMAQVFKMDTAQMNPVAMNNETVAMDKLFELDPQLKIEDIKVNPHKVSEQFVSEAPILGGGAAVTALAMNQNAAQKDMTEEEMKEQLADQMIDPSKMPSDKKLDFAVDKLGATVTAGALAGQPNQMSNENVEKLISGSQALIKKGGGEMKIQLNPEGLGQIHLNIKVQDGQVGVQMMADTHEAKKLLETSMSDLKVGLADHKLNLNHMKVDVADQASQNMNQQNHDFKREEARDFLGQFRQFNESFRQGAMDMGAKAYRKTSPSTTPDIQPIESKKQNASKSGGLYLVA